MTFHLFSIELITGRRGKTVTIVYTFRTWYGRNDNLIYNTCYTWTNSQAGVLDPANVIYL